MRGSRERAGSAAAGVALAPEAEQGWWTTYTDLGISHLIELETGASRISSYESSVIPWMFQTGEYARAVIRGILPRISDRILDERVKARLRRQEILTREAPPAFVSLVDESALRRPVGGSQVMRDQLKRMAEIASIPSITLQVVPLSLGAHPGLDGAFTLLEFEPPQPAVVYVENIAGTQYLKDASEVGKYQEALQDLRREALDAESSVRLVDEIGQTFDSW